MRLWRISSRGRAPDLVGEGSRLFGGRWNSRGTPVVYSASSISLAILESFVHFDPQHAPADAVLIAIDVPARARSESIDQNDLPQNWIQYPAPPELAALGDRWAWSASSLILKVPSAVVPEEFNILLNPLHRGISKCTAQIVRPFQYDHRMKKER